MELYKMSQKMFWKASFMLFQTSDGYFLIWRELCFSGYLKTGLKLSSDNPVARQQ